MSVINLSVYLEVGSKHLKTYNNYNILYKKDFPTVDAGRPLFSSIA